MRKATITIVALSSALVLTNALWAYRLVDAAVSYTYLQDSYRHAQAASEQALVLLPEVGRTTATKQSIIDAAAHAAPGYEPFEKDGYLWVGELGLRFDANGRLVDVRTSIGPLEAETE